jgi:hypothetical protein
MDTGNLDVRDFTHALIAIKDAAIKVCEESVDYWRHTLEGPAEEEPHDTGRDSLNEALGVLRQEIARLGPTGAAERADSDDAGDAIREDAAARDGGAS